MNKNTSSKHLLASFFAMICLSTANLFADTQKASIPPELKGFRGMMIGELLEKKETSLVFKVEKIKKTWKGNRAKNPRKAIGKSITLSLDKINRNHNGRIMKNYRDMKAGDRIELEAFDLEESTLCIKEWLKKTEPPREENEIKK